MTRTMVNSLDFNGQDIDGLGPLQYDAQRGMSLLPTYVVTPNREPLGTIDSWRWACEFRDEDGVRIDDILESDRWMERYERVAETAVQLPHTRYVYVRSKHNRTFPKGGKLCASAAIPGGSDYLIGRVLTEIPAIAKHRQFSSALPIQFGLNYVRGCPAEWAEG